MNARPAIREGSMATMSTTGIRIGLIGDRDDTVTAHRAIPIALELASAALDMHIDGEWLPTETLVRDRHLYEFDALWCVPASPYRSTDGALQAIRFAREERVPFLGTCGGFQHAVLEHARNVMGWADATHAELDPDSRRQVVSLLACSLVEERGAVHFAERTRIRQAYAADRAVEGYHCRFGLNETIRDALLGDGFRVSAVDDAGDVRGLERTDHPFFVATLFQPERAALEGRAPPLVIALARAAKGAAIS
jgi:CTP synthase (UTP-ammonia lyase)